MDEITIAALQKFEPILRYTRGEQFFPMDVERYISECSLWIKESEKPARELIPQGELTVEHLSQIKQTLPGSIYFLKFIDPLDLITLAKYSISNTIQKISQANKQESFHIERGRLARVGYGSRFIDALFSLTLFLRGRVPGDTAIAAALAYQQLQAKKERFCYYGRLVKENNWIVLQYWYFYPFNNWRSGFRGLNDHEADWEMVSVFCSQSNNKEFENDEPNQDWVNNLQPEWVAYASHDFSGDDLRRRWDDDELEKIGTHPIVYVAAGSHASYFQSGEYMAELEIPFLKPLTKAVDFINNVWVNILRQAGSKEGKNEFNIFRIPFIDYARGDGRAIGNAQEDCWEPFVLSDSTPWAINYRGLWGLYAEDPIAGENAPAGPVYNRDGSFRRVWVDPIGWAGLDKVPPQPFTEDFADEQAAMMQVRIAELEEAVVGKSKELQRLGTLSLALSDQSAKNNEFTRTQKDIQVLAQELSRLRQELAEVKDARKTLMEYRDRIQQGYRGSPRAHIKHEQKPLKPLTDVNILTEIISAASVGLLLIGFVAIWLFARHYFLVGLAILVSALIFIEAGFRRQLGRLINSVTIGLAVVTFFILLFQFFWQIVIVGVLLAGLFILWDNIRELRR
ncbi:MAG: hypothetical protein ACPL3P_06655 [Anaerolineales bacterium]